MRRRLFNIASVISLLLCATAGVLWVLLLSMLPVLRVVLYAIRRRPVPGGCTICGYNLTGNTSGVCPECGTRIARQRATTRSSPS